MELFQVLGKLEAQGLGMCATCLYSVRGARVLNIIYHAVAGVRLAYSTPPHVGTIYQ